MGWRYSASIMRDTISPKLDGLFIGPPIRDAIEGWLRDDVLPEAKRLAPKDTEALANSLTHHISGSPIPRFAGFRSHSRKFWFVHGRFALPAPPRRRSRPHFPPPTQSLIAWSNRHGIPVYMVQLAIARHGTPIVPFVAEAIDANMSALDRRLRRASDEIERAWGR